MTHRVFIRVATQLGTGIRQHFPIRASEWIMAMPAIGMWYALTVQPDMFSKSQSYTGLAKWANEDVWAFACLVLGSTRLVALVVNGSFGKSFTYSPHLRMFASLLGVIFWSQYGLGFIDSAISHNGAVGPIFTYATLVCMELLNFWRSNLDRLTANV